MKNIDILTGIIEDCAGVEPEFVLPESRFVEDLGLDSLDMAEMSFEIEEAWDVIIEETDLASMTVQDVLDKLP